MNANKYLFAITVLALMPAVSSAQTATDTPPPTPPSPPLPALHQYPNVAETLKLSPEQTRRLEDMNRELQARTRDAYSRAGGPLEREREAARQAVLARYNLDTARGVSSILNADQMARYRQLQLQYQGPGAFFDAEVQRQLALTQEQINQFAALRGTWDQQFQGFLTVDPAARVEAARRWEAMQRLNNQRINSILNQQQMRSWSGMVGESFRFAPPF